MRTVATCSQLNPSHLEFDYIVHTDLRRAMARHAREVNGRVLDYGCGRKPYVTLFENVTEYVGADFLDNPWADVHLDAAGRPPTWADLMWLSVLKSWSMWQMSPSISLNVGACSQNGRENYC